jgi:exodeoxyribonuclease V alpha subunit
MPELEGSVERVTFANEENGYTVAKLHLKSGKLATIVGNLPPLYIGELLSLKGNWIRHKEYGEQFQIEEWSSEIPKTVLGIERFLASGLIKGVGPATAQKIVRRFGAATLEVIAETPEKIAVLPGINLKKAERIAQNLREHTAIQTMMVFLQGIGVSLGYALKIYRAYQQDAITVVKENPYRLADEILGIGFKIADQIAQNMGIATDSPYRIRCGIRYQLNEMSNDGHVYALEPEFTANTAQELGVTELQVAAEIESLLFKEELFREVTEQGGALYLAPFYHSEVGVAAKLLLLLRSPLESIRIDIQEQLAGFSADSGLELAVKQQEAVSKALNSGVMVLTGGPGTGKTTIVRAMLALFRVAKRKVLLAAPTGRAAKRLAETTGAEAKTIHRLLGFGSEAARGNSRFHYNENEPLETEILIVDEFSMVDLVLFYNLLKALKPGTRLIIVGDVDQLPSVGPGSVLRDLIESGCIPTVRLDVIFRQAEESQIIRNAHRINRGEFPDLIDKQDFFFIEESQPERIVEILPELLTKRIPSYLQCDPIEEIQVLTPMRRTVTGVENLNLRLQETLNPPAPEKPELRMAFGLFRLGDKVMQIRNDYKKLVFNGDIGRVRAIDIEERQLMVCYPEVEGEREVLYEADELDQLVLSYAISVHKSQGNEYPVVVMPLTTQHYLMLQRNLLYTAVTRARKMVLLIGTKKAVAIAVANNKIEERHSLLRQRLQKLVENS